MAGIHSQSAPSKPAAAPGASPLVAAAPTAERLGAVRPLRCFLVEDSPVILQNLVATLEELLGAEVVGHAVDETGAMAWAREHPHGCDIMVIDIFLKAGSGLEVLRQVRPSEPEMHLVVLTNYATADMRRRCLDLGADRVFDKSAELEEMLAYCEAVGGGEIDR